MNFFKKNQKQEPERFKEKKERSLPVVKPGISGTYQSQAINKEFIHLNKLKQKKIFSKEKKHRFTLKGFVKAIDLQENLFKAGLEKDAKEVTRSIFKTNTIICVVICLIVLLSGFFNGKSFTHLLILITVGVVVLYLVMLGLIWVGYLFYVDMAIFNRTKAVELVFPDFLQLASANISAGMPADRALWYAVRPNFGVLAKEIEIVAKNTMAGQDLNQALRDFSHKYDSKVIQRSINLMLEGLAAGGEMASLLNKISLNIEENRILKKEMAANVTTYVIFISFATIFAAPFLFGLSTQLLSIITEITGKLGSSVTSQNSFFSFSFASQGIKIIDFKIFSYITLTISAIASACIVSVIQKGRVKEGLSKIPVFIAVSIILYTISIVIMNSLFSGILQ